jgi:hypothetical protein
MSRSASVADLFLDVTCIDVSLSVDMQVMELLKKRCYAAALSLIASVSSSYETASPGSLAITSTSPTWCHQAVAQAALQLFQVRSTSQLVDAWLSYTSCFSMHPCVVVTHTMHGYKET